jgi:hypothetical protein
MCVCVSRDFHFGFPKTVEYTPATIFLIIFPFIVPLGAAFAPVNRRFRLPQNIKTDKSHVFSHFRAGSSVPRLPPVISFASSLPLTARYR